MQCARPALLQDPRPAPIPIGCGAAIRQSLSASVVRLCIESGEQGSSPTKLRALQDAEGLEGSRPPPAVMPQAPPERPNPATRGAVPLTVAERAKATLGKGSLRAVLPNQC